MSSLSSTISSLVFAIAVLHGEAHLKRAAFADLAFHADAPSMRLDDQPGLKHADAESLFLRTLEGKEQAVVEERLGHAATVVHDSENNGASNLLRLDVNAPSRTECLARVDHQVGDDALDLLAVSQHFGQRP